MLRTDEQFNPLGTLENDFTRQLHHKKHRNKKVHSEINAQARESSPLSEAPALTDLRTGVITKPVLVVSDYKHTGAVSFMAKVSAGRCVLVSQLTLVDYR